MSTEANKALVRRFYEEIDKGNLAAMDELVAEDYIDHSPPPFPGLSPGRAGLKQAFEIFWVATPGEHHIEEQIAEGDKVVTRIRVTGVHEDDLPGIPKTGNKLETTATVTHRIEDGRLAEKWSNKDELGFLQQLGDPYARRSSLLSVGSQPAPLLLNAEQRVQPARIQLALLDPQVAREQNRDGRGGLAVERNYPRWGAGAATSPSTPGRLIPPGLCRCAGRPSSAAPDLTCSVSIARERANCKARCLNATASPPTRPEVRLCPFDANG